jgi:dTDP-4-amino-4,6-dideoxygalactose transaminase
MIDPCNFYWEGRDDAVKPFAANGSRASEFQGAILNVQLDRLPGLLETLRKHKAWLLKATAETDLKPTPRHSPDGECATALMYQLPSSEAAESFAAAVEGTILLKTGRHTYTEWDQILERRGAHHPALNPFDLPQNAQCRKDYRPDMCPTSLDILGRTVSIGLHPDQTQQDLEALATRIKAATHALP